MLALKSGLRFLVLASKVPYLTGTFDKSARFQVQKKLALPAPQSKNGLQKPRETPPKMVG